MITMDKKQEILHYYRVDGLGLREIARKTGVDRKTVTKLINSYEVAIKADPETGVDEFLSQKPKYTKRKYVAKVLKDDVSKEIDKWLNENERRKNNGMRKQCLKVKDIHRELLKKGLVISYSSVCKYVKKKKDTKSLKQKDVYLRIHREPGIECEFDWGEVKLFIGKQKTTLMMAVFCFPYSKMRKAYLFHRQDTLAFMESHRNFFCEVEGVPHIMVYDNMKVAVVFDDKEKRPTVALQRLSNFYGYQWRFCNARAGWEKGNVERSVDYIRSRAFTSRVDFDSLEEAQEWLSTICNQINIELSSISSNNDNIDKVKQDLTHLKAYPGEIGCYEISEYKSDKQSVITIKTNHYSIPEELAGQRVVVKMYSEKIVILNDKHKVVAVHPRSYGMNEWIVDINHYYKTLLKKTGAIQHTEAFHQMPNSMQVIYHQYFKDNGKEFLHLVRYVKSNNISYDMVLKAADTIRKRGVKTFTARFTIIKDIIHILFLFFSRIFRTYKWRVSHYITTFCI